MRLDLYLVEKGLAKSRTHAQELIDMEQVYVIEGPQKVFLKKASAQVHEGMRVGVEKGPANRFVSRGGLKLEGALERLGISVENWDVLDVGISTGGFTDCLLQKGAASVLGVDVGHGQVDSRLLKDTRLHVIEGINARNLSREQAVLEKRPSAGFQLIVMDVSFISISLIAKELLPFFSSDGKLLSLVKPQFEVGVDGLSKGGIVKDISLFVQVEEKIRENLVGNGYKVLDYFPSLLEGKDGNSEFFVYAQRQ